MTQTLSTGHEIVVEVTATVVSSVRILMQRSRLIHVTVLDVVVPEMLFANEDQACRWIFFDYAIVPSQGKAKYSV